MKAHFYINGKFRLQDATPSIGALPYHGFGPCPIKEESSIDKQEVTHKNPDVIKKKK